jgi:hypothetical protein
MSVVRRGVPAVIDTRDRLEWSEVDSKKLKFMLATAGAGAVLAMEVLPVAVGDVNAAVPQTVPAGTGITTGETTKESTPPTEPETSMAAPPITTPPFTIPTGEPQ